MSSYSGHPSQDYAPSAPPLPDPSSSSGQKPATLAGWAQPPSSGYGYQPTPPPDPSSTSGQKPATSAGWAQPLASGYGYQPPPPPDPSSASGQKPTTSAGWAQPPASGYGYQPPPPSHGQGFAGYSSFPPGTHPEVVRAFQAVDRDGSGSIDEGELQSALSSGYQRFIPRTVRLLMFLFGNPANPSKIGPAEFSSLWNCLGQWRAIFERFDRDRSGKVDSLELRDALRSIGFAVPPSVIQVLVSKYDDAKGGKGALNFDSFVECGTIVKGLTEKFMEKDRRYTGSATLTYDEFLRMVIPFLVE